MNSNYTNFKDFFLSQTSNFRKFIERNIQENNKSKNYTSTVLGISGGIDSSITAALAAASIGAENVFGVIMPSRYTANSSIVDAEILAKSLGIKYTKIAIDKIVKIYTEELGGLYSPDSRAIENQNIQSRIRANILLYISNKEKKLLLNTANKSELLTGYYTLYGDSCGDYNFLAGLYKTEIFEFGHWLNVNFIECGFKSPPILDSIIKKDPTAELTDNQKDSDDLLPYNVLDAILIAIENNLDLSKFKQDEVEKVLARIKIGKIKHRLISIS